MESRGGESRGGEILGETSTVELGAQYCLAQTTEFWD